MTQQTTHKRYIGAVCGAIMCALLLFSASCNRSDRGGVASNAQPETREVTDEAGKHLRLPVKIERIVSLAPNLTEIVYAVGAGNRLVGNTTYCDYPPEAIKVDKVGDTMQPNIESIVGLHPQLVLVSTSSQLEAFTKQMEQQHIPVYVTDPHDLEGVFRTILSLGELFGERKRAEQVVSDLRARAIEVEARVKASKPVKVFYQVSSEPLYTAGRDAFITDLIKRAGGNSVTADLPGAWVTYSDESALASQPEALIIPTYGTKEQGNVDVAASLKTSPAAKSGRVYGINGDLLTRPGPRLVDGLEEMASKLHPEAFK